MPDFYNHSEFDIQFIVVMAGRQRALEALPVVEGNVARVGALEIGGQALFVAAAQHRLE